MNHFILKKIKKINAKKKNKQNLSSNIIFVWHVALKCYIEDFSNVYEKFLLGHVLKWGDFREYLKI